LTEPFAISMPAVSRHLKVLEGAGLISRSRSGQWRSSTLEAAPLKEAADWMERYRLYWDANFDRCTIHHYVRRTTESSLSHGSPGCQPVPPPHAPHGQHLTRQQRGRRGWRGAFWLHGDFWAREHTTSR
jgi:Bacterial regulatory protein, arsR family